MQTRINGWTTGSVKGLPPYLQMYLNHMTLLHEAEQLETLLVTQNSSKSIKTKPTLPFKRPETCKASGNSIRVLSLMRSLSKEEKIRRGTKYEELEEDEQNDSYTIGYNYSSQEEEY